MELVTIGSLIKQLRKEKMGISRKKLADGLCSAQMIYEIERDQYESDPLMIDVLLQRMGKSPDKLERVLQSEMYYMIRIRDLLEKAILKGKKALAESILETYPLKTNLDKMYQYRMKASLFYHIDKDYDKALENLLVAIHITLPEFSYKKIRNYLISTIEMENLLAFERIKIEKNQKCDKILERQHLELCMEYIDKHFTDDEEHAKIYAKCAWLIGKIDYYEGKYISAMNICQKGMEGLRKNTMIYFMSPLLKIIVQAEEQMGITSEHSKCVQYYNILMLLRKFFAKKWYPMDTIFHNCCQKEYHLDYELFRDERKEKGMTQEEFADGIYQDNSSISRFETGKASPNKKTFGRMTQKLGMEKGRYNGYVVADSFEVMELRTQLDILEMRRRYMEARKTLEKMKEQLNLQIEENRIVVKFHETVISYYLGEVSEQCAIEKIKRLMKTVIEDNNIVFYHIPMRNEVLMINQLFILLNEIGQKQIAIKLMQCVLQKMYNSKISLKYRYRSYALLLNNYVRVCRKWNFAVEALNIELLCGKASMIPFCINNILKVLEKEGVSDTILDRWSIAVYYMSDLYFFDKEKEIYREYLEVNRRITIVD